MKISIDDLGSKDLLFYRNYVTKIEIYKVKENKSLVVGVTSMIRIDSDGYTQYTECFNTDEIAEIINSAVNIKDTVQDTHYSNLLLSIDYYFKTVNV